MVKYEELKNLVSRTIFVMILLCILIAFFLETHMFYKFSDV